MIATRIFRGTCRLTIVIFACLGMITGCETTPQTTSAEPAQNTLRVGVSTNAPPLIYKSGGKIGGLEAEFARAFANYLGKSLQFVELKWDDQIAALLDNKIDIIMSGMSITKLREMRIAFSEPYFRSGQMALIRSRDLTLFRSGYYSIVKTEKVGYVKNTTGEYFIQKFALDTRVSAFPNSKKGVEALIDKKIDVFIHDAPIILYLASEFETKGVTPLYSLLTEEYLAWAIRIEDTALLTAANNFLKKSKEDGTLGPMIQRWIPLSK